MDNEQWASSSDGKCELDQQRQIILNIVWGGKCTRFIRKFGVHLFGDTRNTFGVVILQEAPHFCGGEVTAQK